MTHSPAAPARAARSVENEVAAAVSIYRNKGAFAILLGSGVSRAAKIKTGWEIVLDLLDELALLKCGPTAKPANCQEWYRTEYGKEPDYADLLDELSSTPGERIGILNKYFTPTAEELEDGAKRPTTAHRAIARLVKSGFVRVIVTTNFDHLMEDALTELGVSAVVVRSDADVRSMIPAQHNACTVLKVNGDYTDSRFKNSPDELAQYSPDCSSLLGRLFSEYGLIICGWSAKWDVALREAIESNPCDHYGTYWCSPNNPDPSAETLINIRKARTIAMTADAFFEKLATDIEALEHRLEQPLSTALLVERLKKYLATPESNRIRINDLVNDEVGRFVGDVVLHHDKKDEAFVSAAKELVDRLGSLIATGIFWSGSEFSRLWIRSFRRIATETFQSGDRIITLYPIIFLFYCAGIAGIASNTFDVTGDFLKLSISGRSGRDLLREAIRNIGATYMVYDLNKDLLDRLWTIFRPQIASKAEFEEMFDKWEYLLSIALADPATMRDTEPVMGLFIQRGKHSTLSEIVAKEFQAGGGLYPPVALCSDSQEFAANKTNLDQYIRKEGTFCR